MAAGLAAFLVANAGCANGNLAGHANTFVTIDALEASSGATPGSFSGDLASDVLTRVQVNGQFVDTIFADNGRARFSLGRKDPTSPISATNFVTINRYHVDFIRADGLNVQGVHVPFSFDGAATGTVNDAGGVVTFTIVRAQAKTESPLAALVGGGGFGAIATLAEVTFFGEDQAGRSVKVTGRIGVIFADWGDPD
jgi:hypothetical protein